MPSGISVAGVAISPEEMNSSDIEYEIMAHPFKIESKPRYANKSDINRSSLVRRIQQQRNGRRFNSTSMSNPLSDSFIVGTQVGTTTKDSLSKKQIKVNMKSG